MLQAKTKDGTLIIPAKLTRTELEKARRKTFYCPVCHERVILKAGQHVIPHFAHYARKNCPTSHGGEGPYHEQGKLILYQWLKSQHLSVKLEPYLRSIQQQPDILLTIDQKKIAIEFQCSRISTKIIQARNDGYKKLNIEPIWILGKELLKYRSKRTILLDSFTKQFLHQFSPSFPLTLFYFCPIKEVFIQVQHIHLLKQTSAYAQLHLTHLSQINFLDLFDEQIFHKNRFLNHLEREKRNFRIYPMNSRNGRTLAWYNWLYKKQTHVQFLPPHVYLPVPSQIYMKTPLWDWQSRLCLDIVHPTRINEHIHLSFCQNYFKHVKKPLSIFPLIKHLPEPIFAYLKLLESFNIVKQVDKQTFIKTKPFNFPNHVEQAVTTDRKLLLEMNDKFSFKV